MTWFTKALNCKYCIFSNLYTCTSNKTKQMQVMPSRNVKGFQWKGRQYEPHTVWSVTLLSKFHNLFYWIFSINFFHISRLKCSVVRYFCKTSNSNSTCYQSFYLLMILFQTNIKIGSHQSQEYAALFISISFLPYQGISSAHSLKIYKANPLQPL